VDVSATQADDIAVFIEEAIVSGSSSRISLAAGSF
jgi:hypothetical protein